MDRSSRQKISKEILALNDTLSLMDLIDIPLTLEEHVFELYGSTSLWIYFTK